MKHQLSKKRNLQRRLSRMKETSSSEGNNTLLSSCTYLVCIVSVHILYIYLLEDNMFQEVIFLNFIYGRVNLTQQRIRRKSITRYFILVLD
jgi:hypothetical protein